jgi:hypothetical protein
MDSTFQALHQRFKILNIFLIIQVCSSVWEGLHGMKQISKEEDKPFTSS